MKFIILIALVVIGCSSSNKTSTKNGSFISLAPSITENFIYINSTNKLVGVTKFETNKKVAHIKRIGGMLDPDIEKIVKIAPYAIYILPEQKNILKSIKNSNLIEVKQTNLQSIDYELKKLANTLGKDSSKIHFLDKFKPKHNHNKTKNAIVIIHIDYINAHNITYYVASKKSYFNDILKKFNIKNLFDGPAYTKCDLEIMAKKNPDIIINLATTDISKENLAKYFSNTNYISINNVYASIPGPISTLHLFKKIDSLYVDN